MKELKSVFEQVYRSHKAQAVETKCGLMNITLETVVGFEIREQVNSRIHLYLIWSSMRPYLSARYK